MAAHPIPPDLFSRLVLAATMPTSHRERASGKGSETKVD